MHVEIRIMTRPGEKAGARSSPVSRVAVVLDTEEDTSESAATASSEASPLLTKVGLWLRILGSVLLLLVTIVSAHD